VQVVYDPAKIGYQKLLAVYWHNVDPTVRDCQFCDTRHQFRSAIFYHSEAQRRLALQSKEALDKDRPFKDAIVTEVTQASEFTPLRNTASITTGRIPSGTKYYRTACGRDNRLQALWGKGTGY
jgi:peptide-methionine (S)-S-oxide reductase